MVTSRARRLVMKSAAAYSGTNVLAQVVTFLSGFAVRRLLPPEVMGTWNFVVLARGYVQPITLGALAGALRELSILKGRNEPAEEVSCRSVALWFSLVEAAVLAVGLWAYTYWHLATFDRLKVAALVVTGVLVILGKVQEAYITFFQGAQLYVALSRVLLVTTVLYAVALPVGAYAAGLPGLLVAAIVAELCRGLWSYLAGNRAGLTTAWMFDTRMWKRLVSYGIGFRMADYPQVFFLSLDVLWVSRLLGLGPLALYALAKSFYSQASDVTTRMGTVLSTRTLMQHGEGVGREKIGKDMLRFMQFQLFVSIPLVSWAVAAAAPFLIRHITPLYSDSVPVLLVLLLCSFFISNNNNIYVLWLADKRLVSYGLSNLFGVLATGGSIALMWFVLGRVTLRDVAVGTVIGYALYFVYMVFSAGREIWGIKTSWKVLLQAACASGWTAGVLWLFGRAGGERVGWEADLVHSAAVALGTLIVLAPLIVAGVWVTGSSADLLRWIGRRGRAEPVRGGP